MITLALDASTYAGDVAVLDGPRVLAERTTAMKGALEERLMPAVRDAIAAAGFTVNAIERVVCGAGPGSFTSLRIAGAIAKGIATGIGCPLYAVSSMALIVGGASRARGRYLVAIDALRGEFYVGLYDVDASGVSHEIERARLVSASAVASLAREHGAKIISPTATLEDVAIVASPRAHAVGSLESTLEQLGPVDIATWEPAYGRLAEAQVKWEATHGRPLPAA